MSRVSGHGGPVVYKVLPKNSPFPKELIIKC